MSYVFVGSGGCQVISNSHQSAAAATLPLEIARPVRRSCGSNGRWWTCVREDDRLSHLRSIGVRHTNVRVSASARTTHDTFKRSYIGVSRTTRFSPSFWSRYETSTPSRSSSYARLRVYRRTQLRFAHRRKREREHLPRSPQSDRLLTVGMDGRLRDRRLGDFPLMPACTP
jgi:hypothetical protein